MADALNSPIVPSKPKHSLLPVLVVLFLISYGLLARLVVEQDRVISFQLTLIRQLLGDSRELTALKGKIQRDQKQNHAQAPAQRSQAAPDGQSETQENRRQKHNRETRRPKAVPEHPPIPASDAMDERRAQVKI